MPFRHLIDSKAFAPEALQSMYEAFDQAWIELAPEYAGDEQRVAFARDMLARAVLSAGERDTSEDPVALKAAALTIFQRMANPSAG
jgi:hypothetical protein